MALAGTPRARAVAAEVVAVGEFGLDDPGHAPAATGRWRPGSRPVQNGDRRRSSGPSWPRSKNRPAP